ncbi:uncharacterized protein O3C94_022146 [Discoglossus pictus]
MLVAVSKWGGAVAWLESAAFCAVVLVGPVVVAASPTNCCWGKEVVTVADDPSNKVTPSGLSESDQEEETNMRSPREIKEEEIPVNISDGPDTYSLHIVTVKEEEENEREEDDGDTQQSVIHSDPCQGPLDVKPPVVSKVEQEDLNIRDQEQVKEEEGPGNIREDVLI